MREGEEDVEKEAVQCEMQRPPPAWQRCQKTKTAVISAAQC